jgi:hypothetical protein
MSFDTNRATQYIKSVDLSGTPRSMIVRQGAEVDAGEVFDKAKAQAQIIGSGVFSFAQGVTPEVREAISDSALLAQLIANKKTSVEQDPLGWFKEYSHVLQNVGWTLQEGSWNDYTAKGTAVEVHEKIIEVLGAALGPSATALTIITSTLNALKAMKSDSPWITLFSHESQKAKIARFQIGLVEKEEKSDVFVSLLVCLIEAKSTVTQVLFFKFKDANASFKANGAKVSINGPDLIFLGPGIRNKVRAYQLDYMSSILDLPAKP